MKTLLICFSQTGNTRRIAECIRLGIMDAGAECDIRDLNETTASSLPGYDLVGIGAPVFYYKEPFHVRDFIEALPGLDGQHWFVFCTHGNVIGNYFPSMTALLEKKGALLVGFHNTYANVTVPFYPKPSYTSGHPDQHDLDQARAFGKDVAERSPKITGPESPFIPAPGPVSTEAWLREADALTEGVLRKVLPKLHIDTETCIQCRECEENCPVHGIDVDADPPRVQEPCIFCWRCVNVCPTLSIGTDWGPLADTAPANYARYKKELDKVTARGEFRWLIDPESIRFDDPLYKQREREIKGGNRKDAA